MERLLASDPVVRALAIAAALVVLTGVPAAIGFALERSGFGARRRIWTVPLQAGQLAWEARANVKVVLLAVACFTAVLGLPRVRAGFGPDTPGRAVATFFATYVWFEAWYYVTHRALHTRALVRFHRLHHASRVTTPLTGFSLSTVEALGWIGALLVPLLVFPVVAPLSLAGWAAYVAYNWSGNVIGHVNVDFMPRALLRRSLSVLLHPLTYHALHHARWTGHYALYSTVLDRALGTEWDDWEPLYAQVLDGRPLASLKARGATVERQPAPAA